MSSSPTSPARRWAARLAGWDRATLALLLAGLVAVVATFRDYGATWDERFQRQIGQATLAWWSTAGGDSRALGGGETGNFNVYGGLFDAAAELTAAALPFDPLESRHLFNACLALLGVAGAALLARRLGGARAGSFAAALLLTAPTWWGHSFTNPKDIPFAAPYPWILLASLSLADAFPAISLRRAVAAGTALGLGLAARPGGVLLLGPLTLGVLAARVGPALWQMRPHERLPAFRSFAGRVAVVAAVAWLLMLVLWPYGLVHPLSGPAASIQAARDIAWDGLVRFAGEWHSSTELPRAYAPTLVLATLPESWFAAAAGGAVAGLVAAVRAWRSRQRPPLAAALDVALVGVAAVGPILAVVVTRPVLYDGIRHLLFVLPALAALAGCALSFALDRLPRWGGAATVAAAAVAAAVAVSDMVALHPYQYVYFNRTIAGGLEGASRAYELDYWEATGREGMAWLVANVAPPAGQPLRVKTTAHPFVASHWIQQDPLARSRFEFVSDGPADVLLATTRWFEHRALGKVLHVVQRMGVPLLYILDVSPTGGPRVLEAGDLALEITLPPGWSGEPLVSEGESTVVYALRRDSSPPAELRLSILSPGAGPVPTLDELRPDVEAHAGELLGRRGHPSTEPIVAPAARGWLERVDGGAPAGSPSSLVAAVRVGPAAVFFEGRLQPGTPEPGGEMLAMIRSVRVADPGDRRVP